MLPICTRQRALTGISNTAGLNQFWQCMTMSATSHSGSKRKRPNMNKFYAVRAGHTPGVYQNWDDCFRQVKGFKGALFKSFFTFTEAEKFMSGDDTGLASNSNGQKYYAVRRGKVPGIYMDWPSAQKQITGWTKPAYRGFLTRADAEAFLKADDISGDTVHSLADVRGLSSALVAEEKIPVKKQKGAGAPDFTLKSTRVTAHHGTATSYEPGLYVPAGTEDGFDTNIILKRGTSEVVFKNSNQKQSTKLRATRRVDRSYLRIFTDGSSLGNGRDDAFAGVGVYFGALDSRNISEPLPLLSGAKQTNQKAELTAIIRALDTAPKNQDVVVVTDSKYAINCCTEWYINWRGNGWKTASGKIVENRDLIESIISRMEERTSLGSETRFEWLKGHNRTYDNVPMGDLAGSREADKLAKEAARKATEI